MNYDQGYNIVWGVVAISLVLAALFSRRLSFGMVARAALGWAAIAAVAYLAIAHRHEIGGMFARVSATLGIDEQQVSGGMVRIRMSPDGHFWARVKLNGVERRMLIDSGATITGLSPGTAAAAGIDTDSVGPPVVLETGNGEVTARRARVSSVAIGSLSTSDLGVVVAPSFGDLDVLGMNFLSRLKSWRVEDNVLVLEPGGDAAAGGDDATADEEGDEMGGPGAATAGPIAA